MTSLRKLNLSQLGLGPLRLWGDASRWAIWSRLWDGIPEDAVIPPERWPSHCPEFPRTIAIHWAPKAPLRPFKDPLERDRYLDALEGIRDPILSSVQLPAVRKVSTTRADRLRSRLLEGKDPVAHAAAIDDLPSVPADLKALTHTVWTDAPLDSQQTLIQSYSRWKMAPGEQKAQLVPWLKHPDWACRFEAYQALVKLDPATPWPSAPMPTPTDEAIIVEAVRLTGSGKPVRMRITFASATRTSRSLVLGLDPLAAPMNVANLVLLARKGYFDGHLVPRVVPDFVVQMGSPCDTMDGGPGYTLRCENTLAWYGPGSVGMALSGKDTGGSQFFITTNAAPHLTGKYTRLGEVEDLDRALKLLDDLELGAKIESIKVLEQ
jgi:cyclophilin family peptidyl-prolyl cis-trans isomerase